ncbi:ParM/StbA family protein [Bacillus sp. Xin]|uniref:ParM/StbA family protein n=1 Tax=unclassified Bacillus (in: firmicutes) TaxID=185979 RepID=UPI001574EA4F|nr:MULTISPECIES: ParM/StbA family protein [unclassified Bacillus (in: firmicutes)]MBC6973326.1 ParM/StbA family protein [Bacillus sp. Xin]NSW35671.1 ParM/StbA family protein [Bacillus sp. Xin1]
MSILLKAGADAGNNGLKLMVKGQNPIYIPSIYSLYIGETTGLLDEEDVPITEVENHIDVTINSPSLMLNNVRYVVGQKVINDQLKGTEVEKKSDKSTDDLMVLTILSGLAIGAMRHSPKLDHINIRYDLSVALPMQIITQEVAAENAKRYMGNHKVIFHYPNGRDVTINVSIEYCKCLPEGASGTWGIVYDEDGNVLKHTVEGEKNKTTEIDFVDKTLLSFDIGAGTTEEVVSFGVNFRPQLSKGLSYGVKETLLQIITRWNRKHPTKTIDSITEFNQIYLNEKHPRHEMLVEESQQAFLGLAARVATDIINKIDDMKDDPYVFIYGGGAVIIKNSLELILKQKGRLKNVIFVENPLFTNARGLLVYTCSPRYREYKQKELGFTNLTIS